MQELENSASSDATVREKIANLPPEVSDINLLSRLEGDVRFERSGCHQHESFLFINHELRIIRFHADRRMGEALLRQVNEAVSLLADYNARLINEMTERKKAANLLRDFIQSQRGLLIQAENRSQVQLLI